MASPLSSTASCEAVRLRTQVRAPLIWILLPLVFGYTAGCFCEISYTYLFFGMVGLVLFFWVLDRMKLLPRWVGLKRRLMLVLILMGVSSIYYSYRQPDILVTAAPPREAVLSFKVDHVYHSGEGAWYASGLATIVDAAEHLDGYVGQKIYFRLKRLPDEALIKGHVIKAKGVLQGVHAFSGNNNFSQYLVRSGVHFEFVRGRFLSVLKEPGTLKYFFAAQNKLLESLLKEGFSFFDNTSSQGIYVAMLLGNKQALSSSQKELFKKTGTLHLFVISALHVGVVAGCIAGLLRILRLPKYVGAVIGLMGLLYYVLATGGSPSAMRAYLMVLFYWGAQLFVRKPSPFSALLGSAVCVLLYNPLELWNIGFQLSYGVVGAILLYGLPLYEYSLSQLKFYDIQNRWINSVLGLLSISLAACLISTPLSIIYFNIMTPGGVFLSLLLIPMASVVIVCGELSLIMGGLLMIPYVSFFINTVAWLVIDLMEVVIRYGVKLPGLFFDINSPIFLVGVITVGALFGWMLLGHSLKFLQSRYYYLVPVACVVMSSIVQVLLIT